MNPNKGVRAALLGVLVVVATSASAQVYRWVDAKGTVHYSNEAPPAGVNAKKVDINAQPGSKRTTRPSAPRRRRSRPKASIYYPTPADPFTTTITLVRGRVGEIERVRKF